METARFASRRAGATGVAELVVALSLFVAAALAAGWLKTSWAAQPTPAPAPVSDGAGGAQAADAALIAKGAYLAKAADCAGCHTARPAAHGTGRPPDRPAPFAGGLPLASPFGTIWSSNVTPDPHAGIGRYTYDDFARALRDGIARGGKRLYPAMPYPSFSKIGDDDMHALYAYFMHGVQPVSTPAPQTHLSFPFNQRWALALWDWAFAPRAPFAARADRDAQFDRGAYLVQSLGHCGACHTPRGPAYQELGYTDASRRYLTGAITNDRWFAPNLTGDRGSGLGRWSADDIAAFLKHGHGGGAVTFGSMVEVVEDSTQYLSDGDLQAIAAYLKALPPRAPSGGFDANPATAALTMTALKTGVPEYPGAGIYLGLCARCHRADGMGVAQKYPRLAGNPAIVAAEPTSLIRLLVEGGGSPTTTGGPEERRMPSFADKLTDTEMARVLTFVRNAWGNAAAPVTARDVASVRGEIHR